MNETADLTTRSKEETIGLCVSLGFIIAVSLTGNVLLIFIFIKNPRLRSSFANKLIMSLAVADFLTAAIPLCYQFVTIIDVTVISQGGVLCTLGGLLSYTTFSISIMTMVMLTIDRFLALGYALKYSSIVTPRVKLCMIAYPWLHGAVLTISFAPANYVKFDPKGLDCGLSWRDRPIAFTASFMAIHVALPFVVLLVLNSRTLWLVHKQNRSILNMDDASSTGNDGVAQQIRNRRAVESKLAKVSSIIVFVFLICWAPYIISRSLVVVLKIPLSSAVMSSAAWIVHASSFANPIIYSSLRTDVQQALCKMFKKNKIQPTLAESRSKTHGSSDCKAATQNTRLSKKQSTLSSC